MTIPKPKLSQQWITTLSNVNMSTPVYICVSVHTRTEEQQINTLEAII